MFEKNFLIFRGWIFPTQIPKKKSIHFEDFSYFSKQWCFYILGHTFPIFSVENACILVWNFPSLSLRNKKDHPEKFLIFFQKCLFLIFRNETLLSLSKRLLLYFRMKLFQPQAKTTQGNKKSLRKNF